MENLKPITWTRRPLRVIWHISTVIVAALLVRHLGGRRSAPRAVVVGSDRASHSGSNARR